MGCIKFARLSRAKAKIDLVRPDWEAKEVGRYQWRIT